MTSPCTADVLGLFERIAPQSWFENLTPTTGAGSRRGIYSLAVVIWLMIVQRMQAKGTLGSALQQLLQNRPVTCCRRASECATIESHPTWEAIAKPGRRCPHW